MDRENVLDPKKNPWFQFGSAQLFLARRGGKMVGRIAAIDDPRYNEFHETKTGFFGFFECIDDVGRGEGAARDRRGVGARRGASTSVMGPANFSSNGECAFLIDGFDTPPAIMMPYNPPLLPDAHRGLRLHQGEGPVGLGNRLQRGRRPRKSPASPRRCAARGRGRSARST